MDEIVNRCAQVVVCADDYGLSSGVGEAIRDLITQGKITATSCMTVSELWPFEAARLRPLSRRCDAGLHLTLTDQRALGPMPRLAPDRRLPSLGALMAAAALRRLDREEIEAEIERQLAGFESEMGMPPAFIDGHQHVHQLPIVRDALLAVYERRLRRHGSWLRYCVEPIGDILRRGVAPLRATLIALLGRGLARRGRAAGIPGNNGFRGVRAFTPDEDFPSLMRRFLARPRGGMVIMCHPGIPDDRLAAVDPVVGTRQTEYDFLRSAAFDALLRESGVALVRLGDTGLISRP